MLAMGMRVIAATDSIAETSSSWPAPVAARWKTAMSVIVAAVQAVR